MTLREQTEALEREMLSPFACLSSQSRGRQTPLEPCPTRTCFQRDIDRIIHSKAFRRLKHKTQVFLEPEGDHYRTRMTHTIEVSRIARTIARGLRLNEDLAEAAAYGHDLGHTPFGHAGERVLNEILPGGFAHNEQSLRVVDRLEKEGEGLNLTYEVRRGILCHTGPDRAETLEGQLLRLADKIAYINHDIDDAIRGRIIYPMDIPLSISQVLGFTHSERINTLTVDIITQSAGRDAILQSPACRDAMGELRAFMFEFVYRNPVAKGGGGEGSGAAPPPVRLLPAGAGQAATGVSGHQDGGGRGAGRLRLYCGHDRRLRRGVLQRGVHSEILEREVGADRQAAREGISLVYCGKHSRKEGAACRFPNNSSTSWWPGARSPTWFPPMST